ncbi:MAG: acyl-CoA dehydrogenase family protein [Deltaproteobacteria bacterium]|nr:acyl-CoA dehydrogenase family protein [Deltaproteobacteria bacterium]
MIPDHAKEYINAVKAFVDNEINPIADEVDRKDNIPDQLIDKMAQMGLFGLLIPREYEGLGFSVLDTCLVSEELAKGGLAFVRLIAGGGLGIVESGTEEQKRRFLPRLAKGELIGATTMTESEAGSDAGNIKTTAVLENGQYVLNGTKTMISRADIAGLFYVSTVTNPEATSKGRISRILVERDRKGLTIGSPDPKLGLNGIHNCQVTCSNCRVPKENLLGKLGEGFSGMLDMLNIVRLWVVAAAAVGSAQRLLEMSIWHANERIQFDKTIGSKQAIQWMLAEMATEIHAARVMVHHAAWIADQGKKIIREAAMAKLFASEMAFRVANKALQIHGGMGYMKAGSVERLFRDNRVGTIIDGTSEIQKFIIARDLLKQGS